MYKSYRYIAYVQSASNKYMYFYRSLYLQMLFSHRLCGKCQAYLSDGLPCQSPACQDVETNVEDTTFLELPIDIQLKGFFEGEVI